MKYITAAALTAALLTPYLNGVEAGQRNTLKGSKSALLEQNRKANEDDLSRVTYADMEKFKQAGLLVHIPRSARNYFVDSGLPDNRAYTRPWTRLFLERYSSQVRDECGRLEIQSAVRPV